MKRSVFFVTGTDTGVGKTVLAAAFTRHLREQGVNVVALKPICSGGRADARALRAASGNALPLDEVNPWHFQAPLSPLIAARMERRRVTQAQVVARIKAVADRVELVVVEGAGGLLSPLGERFDSRNLVIALEATPIVVCPNRLGALNQLLLTLEALPRATAVRAQIVMVNPPRMDLAARANLEWLPEFVEEKRIYVLDWLGKNPVAGAIKRPLIRKMLDRLARAAGLSRANVASARRKAN